MKQCKCEHWQQCPVCMPHRFDADGNLKPPEPTPLQAARAQIDRDTALLRQALEALDKIQAAGVFMAADGEAAYDFASAAITSLRARLEGEQ
jgi:hypothetical protein